MFNAKYSPSYNNAPQLYVVDSNSTDALDSHSTVGRVSFFVMFHGRPSRPSQNRHVKKTHDNVLEVLASRHNHLDFFSSDCFRQSLVAISCCDVSFFKNCESPANANETGWKPENLLCLSSSSHRAIRTTNWLF